MIPPLPSPGCVRQLHRLQPARQRPRCLPLRRRQSVWHKSCCGNRPPVRSAHCCRCCRAVRCCPQRAVAAHRWPPRWLPCQGCGMCSPLAVPRCHSHLPAHQAPAGRPSTLPLAPPRPWRCCRCLPAAQVLPDGSCIGLPSGRLRQRCSAAVSRLSGCSASGSSAHCWPPGPGCPPAAPAAPPPPCAAPLRTGKQGRTSCMHPIPKTKQQA